jgi:SAM-dependent methyltransferase
VNRAILHLLQARAYHDLAAAQSAPLIALGDRFGLYEALRIPQTRTELATAASIDERWLSPWLTNQVAAGLVTRDGDRYSAGEEQREVVRMLAPAFRLATELTIHTHALETAMRENHGLAFDAAVDEAIARLDPARPQEIVGWLTTTPHNLLEIGCGDGSTLRALAEAFPEASLTGLDLAPRAASSERITIVTGDATALPDGTFDAVLTLDTFHELGDPSAAARAIYGALAEDGVWLLVEPRAPESNEPAAVVRFLSSLELLYCLPASLAHGSAGLGPSTTAAAYMDLLRGAGFTRIRQLEHRERTVLEVRR